jgi:hypothetical protein
MSAASTPDGACLVLSISFEGRAFIRCIHWASFGSSLGTKIAWPPALPTNTPVSVSSLGQRKSTHLIFLDTERQVCQSLLLKITRKSSEFSFRSDNKGHFFKGDVKKTINNSLIDCHADVWTRFPVHAAIRRETTELATHYRRSITFVSSSLISFSSYFGSLIREFETKTRKPTRGLLKQIKIITLSRWEILSPATAVSHLPAGEWLMGMFCLIPIHLAVTGSNRFIPLKDGIISPDFEKQLLGANVAQISEA